jgi:peroxiredoxin
MEKKILLFIFACIPVLLFSQKTVIRGTAKSYQHQEIKAFTNSDYISNLQKEITFCTIDSLGNFLLEFNQKEIQYITLKIGKSITSLYAQPSEIYDVVISPPDSTTYQNPNLEHDVNISIDLKKKTEINALTIDYDKRFDEFLDQDYKAFVSRTPQRKIDSFKVAMHDFYSSVNNKYFAAYIDYTIATLHEETKYSRKKLYGEYLDKRPVLYDHPEYMNFFNSFYKKSVQTFALSKEGNAMNFQINDRGSFAGAMAVLQRADFLRNDTLRELVLIKGLYESYYDGSFKRSSIRPMLQQAADSCIVPRHRQIALNILNSFSRLQKGVAAPAFEIPDKTGQTHSLDELRSNNKFVYLMFYDETCTACLQQMKVVTMLKKTYGEKIQFVSISTDKSNISLKNFLQKNPKYDWLFLYDNTLGKLRADYELRALPAYFLIGPDGKFVQVPAESPDGEIEQLFYDLTKVKSKLHNVGNRQNN